MDTTDTDKSGSGRAAPLNVGDLPETKGPAASEDAFLRLQKQRPLPSAAKRDAERPRPGDITVTGPSYQHVDPNATSDLSSQSLRQAAMTPRRSSSPFAAAGSPTAALRSASPRHLSPATSQIFERDVQESTLGPELSPAIPSHIQTEDHIPPVLEASSEVITNSRLDPGDVEIVTHASHQPAALSVAGSTLSESQVLAPASSHGELGLHNQESEDAGSSYGAVDPSDPRRLSFISFADVVHAEQVDAGKDAASHLMSPSSFGSRQGGRSPSPARSPVPDRSPLSPTMSGSGYEGSPSRGAAASIASGHSASQHGDLTIETMRQTLEKTGNSDLNLPGTAA